ncbi:MAG: MerR family transcriptional regulator [Desulfobulbaceae bacterium]
MAGVTNDTVRFYERCGLLDTVGRSESNYRLYRAEDVNRLRFIRRSKELGFSLNEIKDLLALSRDPGATKADIQARTEKKRPRASEKKSPIWQRCSPPLSSWRRRATGPVPPWNVPF